MNFSRLFSQTCKALALGVLAVAAHAQDALAPDDQAHEALLQQRAQARAQERAEIARARSAVMARKQEAEKACWQRFAVERCLGEARAAAREEDNALHERELRLNREERQEKANERLRAIERKQREKPVPAPVTVTPRDGSGVLSTETRSTEAQKRAAEQARRVQAHEASAAAKQQEQAQARAKAAQEYQAKQAEAAARRASKADEIAGRKGAPLPVPEGLPKP
jgi:colicin import membrane protein